MHRWLFFQTAHVSPPAVTVFRATHPRVKAFWGEEPEVAAVAAARKELARFLPLLEWRLSDCEWLAGEFSIADIAYAPHLFMLAGGNFDFSPYPRLHAWFDRLQARPAWRKDRDAMKIAVIGWGSIVWDPGELATGSRWHSDGPELPVEFARKSRDGRLTLVIHESSSDQRTYWALSALDTVEAARESLRQREGSPSIATIRCTSRDNRRDETDPVELRVSADLFEP